VTEERGAAITSALLAHLPGRFLNWVHVVLVNVDALELLFVALVPRALEVELRQLREHLVADVLDLFPQLRRPQHSTK